jgi:LmbE family N-acetylglucosaminyl deacetylase
MTGQRMWGGVLLLLLGFGAGWLWHESPSLSQEPKKKAEPVKQAGAGSFGELTLPPNDGKLRIICFGAHPDDCELKAGGVGAKWAAADHHVLFVSVTNGDIGHWKMAGGPLALRRAAEVRRADGILGVRSLVLDIHDGELLPTLGHRQTITRLIRRWKADLVVAHRPNDYHPDHRYTGVLVQDAAYMVTVPFFCPDVPPLQNNPVFLYYSDNFQRPNPFRADVAVDVDDVMEKKLTAIDVMESQFFEGGANGSGALIPKDEAGREKRRLQVRKGFHDRFMAVANKYRQKLIDIYGIEHGRKVRHAEAFELCEYGSQPNAVRLLQLFPIQAGTKGETPDAPR